MYNFDDIRTKKNSLTHNILMITKFYNKIITYSNLQEINSKDFRNTNKIDRSILFLSLNGLVHVTSPSHWIVTPKGVSFLYYFASKNPSHAMESPDFI